MSSRENCHCRAPTRNARNARKRNPRRTFQSNKGKNREYALWISSGLLSFRKGLLSFRAGLLLSFRVGLLGFRAGLLSFCADLLGFRTGLLDFYAGLRGIRLSACALFELNRTTHTPPHRKTTRKQPKSDNDPKTALERAHRHTLAQRRRRRRRRRHGRRGRWLRARPTNAPGGSGRARQRVCRVVRVGAVQAAERGAACGRRLGEHGAALLKRRERGGQVGRHVRHLAKDDSLALAHSQWQEPPRFIDASATSPASIKEPSPSRGPTTRPLRASPRRP